MIPENPLEVLHGKPVPVPAGMGLPWNHLGLSTGMETQLPKLLPQLQCSTIFNLPFGNLGGNVGVGITFAIKHK